MSMLEPKPAFTNVSLNQITNQRENWFLYKAAFEKGGTTSLSHLDYLSDAAEKSTNKHIP